MSAKIVLVDVVKRGTNTRKVFKRSENNKVWVFGLDTVCLR
jgi:hypothetical protein